jgi:hypothetical protein
LGSGEAAQSQDPWIRYPYDAIRNGRKNQEKQHLEALYRNSNLEIVKQDSVKGLEPVAQGGHPCMNQSINAAVQVATQSNTGLSMQYSAVQYNAEVGRQTIGSSSLRWWWWWWWWLDCLF